MSEEKKSSTKVWPRPSSRHKGAVPMPLDFTLTPEQEEIKGLAHEFAEKEIRPVAAHYDETEEFPWPVLKKAHEVGLTPVASMPEAYGGGGGGIQPQTAISRGGAWGRARDRERR